MTTATYFAASGRAPLGRRILQFPLTRMLLALLFVMVPFLLIQAGATHFFDDKLFTRIGQLLGAGAGYASYALYVRWVEKRAVSELSWAGSAPEFGIGFLIGGLMVCATVGAMALLGGYHIRSVSPWSVMVLPLLMHVTIGLIEEMAMRGIFFRLMQASVGSWIALAASAAVFGAGHLVNDNITVLAIANIVAVGVLLAAAFMLTGRLWLCVAIHGGWNFFQDGVFSSAVSGHAVKTGLLVGETRGPDWLTGGAFGFEGSAIALLVVVAVAGGLLYLVQRSGRVVQPFWKRSAR